MIYTKLLYTQHSDVGVKSRSFFTLFDNLSSSAAASVLIAILSGVRLSVPFVRFKIGVLVRLFGAPVDPDFLCNRELKKLASTPSPLGVEVVVSFGSICLKHHRKKIY